AKPFRMFRRLRRTANRTLYVITNRRAIIFDGGYIGTGFRGFVRLVIRRWRRRVDIFTIDPQQLRQLRRKQRPDGSGDLIFVNSPTSTHTNGRKKIPRGFLSIANVGEVEALLAALAESKETIATESQTAPAHA